MEPIEWTFQAGDVIDRKGVDTSALLDAAPVGTRVSDVFGDTYERTDHGTWRLSHFECLEASSQFIADCGTVTAMGTEA